MLHRALQLFLFANRKNCPPGYIANERNYFLIFLCEGKESRNRLSLDGLAFDNGDYQKERKTSFSTPAVDPFDDDLPEDILGLREIAGSLTDRLADVYEALLVSFAGGKERLSMKEIADKWDVHISQVYKDKDKIIRMIREKLGSKTKEEDR